MSSEISEMPLPKRQRLSTRIVERARLLNYLRHPDRPSEGNDTLSLKQDAEHSGFNINETFTLLVWNIHKGRGKYGRGWRSEAFEEITDLNPDIALLQEYMHGIPTLPPNFFDGYDATMTVSFYGKPDNQQPSGVCTMSKVQSQSAEAVRSDHNEIIGTRTPKTALFSTYKTAGLDESLGVIDIHNLVSVSPEKFQAFLEKLNDKVTSHNGPLIFAGDFNTWSAKRVTIVEEFMRRHGLEEVSLPGATRHKARIKPLIRKLGVGRTTVPSDSVATSEFALDRVYVRGLTVKESKVPLSTASDHNPLIVKLGFNRTHDD